MSRGPDVVLPVEALFDVPDGYELVGDEIRNPENWIDCTYCGATFRVTADRCFNCGEPN